MSSPFILTGAFSRLNMSEHFRGVEDDVDAATPVDAQNAPTGVWKSRTEREIPTAPTSMIVSLKKKKNEDQNNSDQLSTRSDQVQDAN